jgi:hypothetical protein
MLYFAHRLVEILSEQRASTKENVERKQARTDGEREEEDEDAVEVSFICLLHAKHCVMIHF